MPPVQPYHYGSHYSNSGTVLHFLVRLPPFTKMFLAYQGQFDVSQGMTLLCLYDIYMHVNLPHFNQTDSILQYIKHLVLYIK